MEVEGGGLRHREWVEGRSQLSTASAWREAQQCFGRLGAVSESHMVCKGIRCLAGDKTSQAAREVRFGGTECPHHVKCSQESDR